LGIPWLKRKDDIAGSSSTPVQMREPDDGEEYDSMHAAAQDLIEAIHSKDIKGVAEALRAAFELSDSEPHEEGPHE
jgi:hypothetical protein